MLALGSAVEVAISTFLAEGAERAEAAGLEFGPQVDCVVADEDIVTSLSDVSALFRVGHCSQGWSKGGVDCGGSVFRICA